MRYHYAFADDDPAADRWLSDSERRAYVALHTPEQRRDWRAGRAAAKRAAAGALGLDDPTRVELVPVAGGAPQIALRDASGTHRIVRLVLSLSHRSGRAAAVATTEPGGLGIDLELAGQVRAAHAGYYLSAEERELEGLYGLTALWTLKEAAWKAVRCDDAVSFTALELRFDTAGAVNAVSLRGTQRPAVATVLRPWPGYVVGVLWVPEDAGGRDERRVPGDRRDRVRAAGPVAFRARA